MPRFAPGSPPIGRQGASKPARMRKRPPVAEAIAKLLEQRTGSSKLSVIEQTARIANAPISDKGSAADKIAALTLLAKIHGMLTNRTEISGPNGRPVSLDIDASNARARIEAKLHGIASRRPAELPAPTERPITLERVLTTCMAL